MPRVRALNQCLQIEFRRSRNIRVQHLLENLQSSAVAFICFRRDTVDGDHQLVIVDDCVIEEVRFATESSLEGTGFEPSVPRGKGPTLRVSVLFHSDFSVGGEPTRGDIERLVVSRGTDGSNPVPSSGESSTNLKQSHRNAVWAGCGCRDCREGRRFEPRLPGLRQGSAVGTTRGVMVRSRATIGRASSSLPTWTGGTGVPPLILTATASTNGAQTRNVVVPSLCGDAPSGSAALAQGIETSKTRIAQTFRSVQTPRLDPLVKAGANFTGCGPPSPAPAARERSRASPSPCPSRRRW